MGTIRRSERKRITRRRQRDILCDVMLSAKQSETLLTLDELTKLTHYPPASISAQLRHLRKPQFGAFVVEKRCRTVVNAMRGEDFGIVWEYRITRARRRHLRGARLRGDGRKRSLRSIVR